MVLSRGSRCFVHSCTQSQRGYIKKQPITHHVIRAGLRMWYHKPSYGWE